MFWNLKDILETNEINEMKQTVDIGWLKVNASPLIKEL